MKIYVAAVEALRENEREDETHSVYHQNWWKFLVWVPVISFCKNFIPRLNLYQISTKFVDSSGLINIVSWMDDVFWSEHCKV